MKFSKRYESLAIIEIQDLTYSYDDFKLGKINLKIESGQWITILGPNGSGKSTLARLIDGLIEAQSGSIKIDGQVLNEKNVWQIRSKIGMVFQNPDNQFVGANVADDIAFGLENRQIPRDEMIKRVDEAMHAVSMQDFAKHEPSKLSGGQKQRVAIAGVLAIRPKIIILDEATSMLDPEGRRMLLNLIKKFKQQYGFTVLSITHSIDEAVNSDRIMILNHGQIILNDTPDKVFSEHSKLNENGLELPFTEQLRVALNKNQVQVGNRYLSEDEMVDKIWELNSKM